MNFQIQPDDSIRVDKFDDTFELTGMLLWFLQGAAEIDGVKLTLRCANGTAQYCLTERFVDEKGTHWDAVRVPAEVPG